MLLRLLITFVVLTINVGNVFAVGETSGDGQPTSPNTESPQHPTTGDSRNGIPRTSRPWRFSRHRTPKDSPNSIDPSLYVLNNYFFNKAICGFHTYTLAQVVLAAHTACPMVGNPLILNSVKPIKFNPKDYEDLPKNLDYYLYPLGKPYPTPSRSHYHSPRVLIDQNCKIRKLFSESKKEGAFFHRIFRFTRGARREQIVYDQNNYNYDPCAII